MSRIAIILTFLGSPSYSQHILPVLTPRENALSGITAVAESSSGRFFNPASAITPGVSASIAGFYRGTGMYGLLAACNLQFGILRSGIGIRSFGDAAYRHNTVTFGATAAVRAIFIGLSATMSRLSFEGRFTGMESYLRLGIQTDPEKRLMAGLYTESVIFKGLPATSVFMALRISLTNVTLIYLQLQRQPGTGLHCSIGGTLRVTQGISFMFGIRMPSGELGAGLQANIGSFEIVFGLNVHPYLGMRSAVGSHYDL